VLRKIWPPTLFSDGHSVGTCVLLGAFEKNVSGSASFFARPLAGSVWAVPSASGSSGLWSFGAGQRLYVFFKKGAEVCHLESLSVTIGGGR
jgi:hypothetical protein